MTTEQLDLIAQLLGGEPATQTFITIIRYVLPSEDHTIQKLLLLYLVSAPPAPPRPWGEQGADDPPAQETIEKTDQAGKLLPEMVRSARNRRFPIGGEG